MGVSLVGTSGFQYGCESAETGINLETFSCRYFPEFKAKAPNYQGQTTVFAIPDKFCREVSIQGEVTGATGIMASVLNLAIVFANDVATWIAITGGTNAGGFYGDEFTENQNRSGWRSMSGKWTSDPLIS